MKTIMFIIISCLTTANLFAQNYWKSYTTNDGLSSNKISGFSIDEETIYIASDSGLSIFDNNNFTNYRFDSLGSSNIKLIRNFKDSVWMVSDSGLVFFHKGVSTLYSESNGLITKDINDVVINSKGDVWVGSLQGLVVIQRDTILRDSSKVIYNLGVNRGDTIYASVNHHAIFTGGGFPVPTVEIFDGNIWTPVFDNMSNFILTGPKFLTLSNGDIGLASSNEGVFLIDSIFRLTQYSSGGSILNNYRLFDIGFDSTLWIANILDAQVLNLSNDAVLKIKGTIQTKFGAGLPSTNLTDIKTHNKKVFISTDNGFAVADESISSLKLNYSINTSSISTTVPYTGELFNELEDFDVFLINSPKFSYQNRFFDQFIRTNSIWVACENNGKQLASFTSSVGGSFVPGPKNRNNTLTKPSIYKISKGEIDFHLGNRNLPGYEMPWVIKNWPANGNVLEGEAEALAPFMDMNNDNCYDPGNGDFPFILGDTAIFVMYNDGGNNFPFTLTESLGIEIHAMVSVFNQPSLKHIDESVFIRYTIINRSGNDYKNVKVGVNNYFNVGFEGFVGCDPQSGIVYKYNKTASGSNSPAVGMKIINSPFDKFLAFSNSGNQSLAPANGSNDYFNGLHGLWSDSTRVSYGGNGYSPNSTAFSNHMFPGDIKLPSEWSQVHTGQGIIGQERFDDLLSVIPEFDLKDGERKVVDLVVGMAYDSTSTNIYDKVDLLIDQLNLAGNFQQGVVSILPEFSYSNCATGISHPSGRKHNSQLSLYPNPSNGELNVLSIENIERIRIVDMQGRLVQELSFPSESKLHSISLNKQIPSGIYFIQAHLDNGNFISEKLILNQ